MTGLIRALTGIERGIERLRPARAGQPVIHAYPGFATPDHLVIRGRVLLPMDLPQAGGRARNLRAMLALFRTRELPGRRVAGPDGAATVTDDEGYFTLTVPRPQGVQGWTQVPLACDGASAPAPVLIPHPDARHGIISDIDDTVMATGAWSLPRNLWTTLTGNAATRRVFPDAVTLLSALSDQGRNPVWFVSSSPWNLQGFLAEVFRRGGLPSAPMFLRDWGLDRDKIGTGTHGSHKGAAIDTLMAANPGLPMVLVGDTGQHDAQVYAQAALRHPGRVARVLLRQAGRPADPAALQALARAGVPVTVAPELPPA